MRQTFYHEGFDPVLSPAEKVFQTSFSYRPMSIVKGSTSFSLNKYLLLRTGFTERVHVDNFDCALIGYYRVKNIAMFGGPTFNYQHNLRNKPSILPMFGSYIYNYNCEYYSPGAVLGFDWKLSDASMQVVFKAAKNLAQQYQLAYRSGDGSGKDIAQTYNEEKLDFRIPDFYSGEADVIYLFPIKGNKFKLKVQMAFLFTQKTFRHDYSFRVFPEDGSSTLMANANTVHPVSGFANFSIGFVYSLARKSNR